MKLQAFLYSALLVVVCSGVASSQIQTVTGLNGMGHSSLTCIDRDGDGYGVGPLAVIDTAVSASVSAGAQTVTPASMSGTITATTASGSNVVTVAATNTTIANLQAGESISGTGIPANTTITGVNAASFTLSANATASGTVTLTISIGVGTVLRVGTAANMERAIVTSATGATFTATFALAHASGFLVSDQGCLGIDADDQDPLVWTTAQATTKYGSIAGLLTKFGNDITIENPFGSGNQSMTAAVVAGLTSPHATWYLSPSGSDSNPCTLASPCLTQTGLGRAGYASGDLLFLRNGWNGRLVPISGTVTKHSTIMSYPGEQAVIDFGALSGSVFQALDKNYLSIIGVKFQNGSYIDSGTDDGLTTSTCNNYFLWYLDVGNGNASIGGITAFNGLVNWDIEYSTFHHNDCGGGTCQHGIYLGSRALVSSNVIVRRNLFYDNAWSGFHFNGRITGLVADQNVAYNNGNNGLSFQQGVSSSFVRGNLLFGNGQTGLQFYNYQGACGDTAQGAAQFICPYDQHNNLIENNTFWTGTSTGLDGTSSSSQGAIFIENDSTGCVETASSCTPVKQGDLGNNVYRNNIFVDYGNAAATTSPYHSPPVVFGTCVAGTSPSVSGLPWSNAPCLYDPAETYLSTSTFDHNVYFETGPYADANIIGDGPEAIDSSHYSSHSQTVGYGRFPVNCSAAASLTTLSGCITGDPKLANAVLSNWNNAAAYDFRLLPASSALRAGAATAVPGYDLAGRAYVDATPSIGALERNLYTYGWNDLGASTLFSTGVCPANGAPTGTNTIDGSTAYPFQTQCPSQIRVWTGGWIRDAPGVPKSLCWWGGGHSDYIGNEIYCTSYNTASPAIARVTNPSTFTGDPGTGATFSATVSGGRITSIAVTSGGSGYLGDGVLVATPTGGDTASPGLIYYTVTSGAVTGTLIADGGAGYAHVPTISTSLYSTGAATWNALTAVPELADGRPNSRHTNQSLVYDPKRDKMFAFEGADAGQNGLNYKDAWYYSASTGWTRLDPFSCGSGCSLTLGSPFDPRSLYSSFDAVGFYDAIGDTYWYLWGGDFASVYNPTTNQFLYGGQNGSIGVGGSYGYADALIPARRLAVSVGGVPGAYHAYKFDLKQTLTSGLSAATTDLTSSMSATCNGLWQSSPNIASGLDFHPGLGKLVGYVANGGSTYYTMDPDALTCTTVNGSGGPAAGGNPYINGRFRWAPSIDAAVLQQDYGQDAFVLSLNAPDPAGASSVPYSSSISGHDVLTGGIVIR